MKKKNSLLNLFPRHVIPDELSLLSLYEIVIYAAIFAICLYYYNSWNRVPVIEKNVYVENIGAFHPSINNNTIVSLDFYISNSTVFPDSAAHIKYSIVTKDNQTTALGRHKILDSLQSVFFKLKPEANQGYFGNLYYFRLDGYDTGLNWDKMSEEKKKPVIKEDNTHRGQGFYDYEFNNFVQGPPVRIAMNCFINSLGNIYYACDLNDKDLLKPSFFSRRDISQTYYRINIHSHSVDSFYVNFHYKGVIDFSSLGSYSPSYITGNEVQFSLKPVYEKPEEDTTIVWDNKASYMRFYNYEEYVTTLQFYVKSTDMENNQSRRVFLISTILSALITIFLAFIIIFIYRLVKPERESR